MSALQPVVGYRSEIGAGHEWNDDVIAGPPASASRGQLERLGYLYVIANGLGPDGAGQAVARLAVETIVAQYYAAGDQDVRERLESAIKVANEAAYAAGRQGPTGMGSAVVTCCLIRGDELYVGHVGDCRVYVVRRDSIQQLTRDHIASHSTGSAAGSAAQPLTSERRLTRVVGVAPTVDVDLITERIRSGDRVLLCTRGLSGALGSEEMLARVRQLGPRRAPDDLVELALGRGVGSSITAIVISAPGAPTPGLILPDRSPRSSAVSIEPPMPVVPATPNRPRKRSRVPKTALALAACVVALAIVGPRLSESAGDIAPRVVELAPVVAQSASSVADGLAQLVATHDTEVVENPLAAPGAGEAIPLETPTAQFEAPGQTATAIMVAAEVQRETAAAESTSLVAAAAVEATQGAEALQASAVRATVEWATAEADRTATAGAARAAAAFPPVRTLVLTQPVKDASTSGKVVFDWTWSGTLATGQAFEIMVCRGPACEPAEGKGVPLQSPWWWCPDEGPGIYRWRAALVDSGSLSFSGPGSDVGQFVWTGGEPCEVPAASAAEDDRDEPTPEPTKEKAPPPVEPEEPGP